MKFESALTWIIRELRLRGVQKEIIDLSLKLDGRPFAGENTVIFSKYSVPYNIFPDSFIVFCNNCVALKKEKQKQNQQWNWVKNYDTKGHKNNSVQIIS